MALTLFEIEYELDKQRHLMLFLEVITYIETLGFVPMEQGCYPVRYGIFKPDYQVTIEMYELDGRIGVSINESIYNNNFQSSSYWEQPTGEFNPEREKRKIAGSFYITEVRKLVE